MSVAENFQTIRNELGDKIVLVAVTKNHGVDLMREAIDAGATDIGENRVQEAAEKFQTLDRKVIRHLIGHLQTNKAKAAVKLFDLIQSVDSQHLAAALDKAAASIGKVQDVLIQVNAAREPQKSGAMLEDLDGLIKFVDAAKNLRLRGLMMIAPNLEDVEECRPFFKQMRELFDKMKTSREAFDFLSMGMTHDYKIAVEEGANVVRVGTAIFGERSYR
ncbi:MAG: YggS family pyridoxal phosphate-dependent enzyme [Quinella sp. 1Q5]|nr:YggS family pyridoxal phosphate-dependent enzyme [Quinella sp. 1Q5]